MMSKITYNTIFMLFCIVASRLLPHPPNFTPVIAVFMLSGIVSLLPCLVAYIISDAIIGFNSYMLWVYGSLFLIAYFQRGAVFSSTLFFVITNFAVWTSGYYGYTAQGLIMCYIMAIPFYISTLTSTVIFATLFEYAQKNNIMGRITHTVGVHSLRKA